MIRRDELHERLLRLNAASVGRSWSTDDREQRDQFIDWFLDLADRLGLSVQTKR